MTLTCGVDEAGRGPLAGPVYAAAVILDPARRVNGLADSKVLTAERREVQAGSVLCGREGREPRVAVHEREAHRLYGRE